jgi:hypothetical protein
VREGHNTVLVVRNPFIAVHGDGIHGESFGGLRDITRGYHAKFSKDVNQYVLPCGQGTQCHRSQ